MKGLPLKNKHKRINKLLHQLLKERKRADLTLKDDVNDPKCFFIDLKDYDIEVTYADLQMRHIEQNGIGYRVWVWYKNDVSRHSYSIVDKTQNYVSCNLIADYIEAAVEKYSAETVSDEPIKLVI